MEIAREVIGSMTRFDKGPLPRSPDHVRSTAGSQEHVLMRFEQFRERRFLDWITGIIKPRGPRVTVRDPECGNCEYEESTFNPNFWNADPYVRQNNNCYNYARNHGAPTPSPSPAGRRATGRTRWPAVTSAAARSPTA